MYTKFFRFPVFWIYLEILFLEILKWYFYQLMQCDTDSFHIACAHSKLSVSVSSLCIKKLVPPQNFDPDIVPGRFLRPASDVLSQHLPSEEKDQNIHKCSAEQSFWQCLHDATLEITLISLPAKPIFVSKHGGRTEWEKSMIVLISFFKKFPQL